VIDVRLRVEPWFMIGVGLSVVLRLGFGVRLGIRLGEIEIDHHAVQGVTALGRIGELLPIKLRSGGEPLQGGRLVATIRQHVGVGVAEPGDRRPRPLGRSQGVQGGPEQPGRLGVLPEVPARAGLDDDHLDLLRRLEREVLGLLAQLQRGLRLAEGSLAVRHRRQHVVVARHPPDRPELGQGDIPLTGGVRGLGGGLADDRQPRGPTPGRLGKGVRLLGILLDQAARHDQETADLLGQFLRQAAQLGPHLTRQLALIDVRREFRLVGATGQPGRRLTVGTWPLAPRPVEPGTITARAVGSAAIGPGPIRTTPIRTRTIRPRPITIGSGAIGPAPVRSVPIIPGTVALPTITGATIGPGAITPGTIARRTFTLPTITRTAIRPRTVSPPTITGRAITLPSVSAAATEPGAVASGTITRRTALPAITRIPTGPRAITPCAITRRAVALPTIS
jgi:hypothetical protein